MNLTQLSKEIYEENKTRGFDVAKENLGQTLMLIVSELSEALEADRKDRSASLRTYLDVFDGADRVCETSIEFGIAKKTAFEVHIKDTFEDEIADAIIRLFDLCGAFNIDIEAHVREKRWYNSTRDYKHGKKY